MSHEPATEKDRQEQFPWTRSGYYSHYNSALAVATAEALLENRNGSSLLDIACGDGLLTEVLAPFFSKVVGVDASSSHLRLARQRLPEARFVESLIEDFVTVETFDTATMVNLLEHVVDPQLVLRKVSSCLAPEGKLIVVVPNAEAINRRIAVHMGTLVSCDELSPFDINVVGHRRSYTLDSLVTEIAGSGMKVVRTGGIFFKTLSSAQMDWFLREGPWEEGGFGWGRVGSETQKDWRRAFCEALYAIGKDRPRDCNCIYACAQRKRNEP